jgi:hypothetical protein
MSRHVTVASGGHARAAILLPPSPSEVERFAAAELGRYVEQMSGVRLPVGATEGHLPIRLRVAPRPSNDGYTLSVDASGIEVVGDNDRGVLYAVYDLLERLGCRFYYPTLDPEDPEVVPSRSTVALEPFSVTEAAGFEWRVAHMGSVLVYLDAPDALHQVDWAAKARYNIVAFLVVGRAADVPAPPVDTLADYVDLVHELERSGVVAEMRKRGMLLEGPLHCMIQLFPNSLHDEHPEWFGMTVDGERVRQRPLGPEFCWSNQAAVDHFAANVVDFVRACPFLDIFAFTPNDGGRPCACPGCAAQLPSDLYANVANTVKRALGDAGLARPVEITGGYPPVPEPPSPGTLDPEVRYHWAHWGRAHHDWYGGEHYGMRENLDGFLALPNPFTMVEYYPDGFATPSIHPPVATAMDRDNRWLLEQGVRGNFQLMHPHAQWWNHTLAAWLAISFYYCDRGARSFLDDYASHYFGPAAADAMVEYHRILDTEHWFAYWAQGERWSTPAWADAVEAHRGTAVLDRLEALLDDAEKSTEDAVHQHRLAKLTTLGRAQIELGRARARNTALVHDVARVASGELDVDAVADRLRAALAFERDVVEPLARSLRDDPRHLGSIDLYDKWIRTDPLLATAIAELGLDETR